MANKKSKKTNKKSQAQPSFTKEMMFVTILAAMLGAGGGYVLGALTEQNSDTVSTSQAVEVSEHGHSSMYMVSADEAPKVELVVVEDAKSGYNVKIIATDFKFTPESVNSDNVVGEGHAHLYVDGEKIGRLYGPYFHYSGSFEGTKSFRVTLNANDHSEYAVDGEVIASEIQVTHDGSDATHDNTHMGDAMMEEEDHPHSN